MSLRPGAEVLLIAVEEIERVFTNGTDFDKDRITECDPWTARDVLAHCSGSLLRLVEDRAHRFTPQDNEEDVQERRAWPFQQVRDELLATAQPAAHLIDAADGALDGLGLGVWVHCGDIRDSVDLPDAYAGPGLDLGLGLLEERSRRTSFSLEVALGDRRLVFGAGKHTGGLTADPETFVRLTGGRSPNPDRYQLTGTEAADLVLFG